MPAFLTHAVEARSSTRSIFRPVRWRPDLAFILILLLGAWLRLLYVQTPLAEAHRWRQITNADIARNMAEVSFDLFHPQVSWGGPSGSYVGMEFPLMHGIVALLYVLFGEKEIFGRLVGIVFSLGTIAAVWALGRRLFGAAAGRGAAFLMAVSPSAVFFGRTLLSDTPMLFFSVAGVLGIVTYLDTGRRAAAVLGAACTGLACLVKIPAVIILVPIAYAIWKSRGWSAVRDPWLTLGLACAMAVTAGWYWHADNLFHQTGLGQAIWHSSGTYSLSIAVSARPMIGVSHWSTLAQIRNPEFYKDMVHRIWHLHLTPAGLAVTLIGLAAFWRQPCRRVVDVWLATVILFILVAAEGHRYHEFHQLPLLPPAALFFGLGAGAAFDGAWIRAHAGRLGLVTTSAVITAMGLLSFSYSGVVDSLFRPNGLDTSTIAAGVAINRVVDPHALVIVVEYPQFGNNSPILLYRAHRRGWSFDLRSISPHVIERLKTHFGADYFATTMWSDLETAQPELASYLRSQTQIPLADAPGNTVLFELKYRPGT